MKTVILDYIRDEYMDEDDDEGIELDENTPLITSGLIDSFSMVSLKRFLEKRYEITIPDDQASTKAFNSVASIARVVEDIRKGE